MKKELQRQDPNIIIASRFDVSWAYKLASSLTDSYRTGSSSEDSFSWVEHNFFHNIKEQHKSKNQNSWVDFYLLQIGNGGLSLEEEKTHMSLWAIAKSPLFLSSNPETMR